MTEYIVKSIGKGKVEVFRLSNGQEYYCGQCVNLPEYINEKSIIVHLTELLNLDVNSVFNFKNNMNPREEQ